MFTIYWLISQNSRKTYVGYTNDLKKRIELHKSKRIKSTKNFGNFIACRLENIDNRSEAIKREHYWKSASGRKKLKQLYPKIINTN